MLLQCLPNIVDTKCIFFRDQFNIGPTLCNKIPQQHATRFTGQRWSNKVMLYRMPPTITLRITPLGTCTQRCFQAKKRQEDVETWDNHNSTYFRRHSSLNPQHFVEMQHVLNVTYISIEITLKMQHILIILIDYQFDFKNASDFRSMSNVLVSRCFTVDTTLSYILIVLLLFDTSISEGIQHIYFIILNKGMLDQILELLRCKNAICEKN